MVLCHLHLCTEKQIYIYMRYLRCKSAQRYQLCGTQITIVFAELVTRNLLEGRGENYRIKMFNSNLSKSSRIFFFFFYKFGVNIFI